jgi:hypothetical protein
MVRRRGTASALLLAAAASGCAELLVDTQGLDNGGSDGGSGSVDSGPGGGPEAGPGDAAGDAALEALADAGGTTDSSGGSLDGSRADADAGVSDGSFDGAKADSTPGDAGSCKNDLSGIGTGDFTVSLRLTTTQTGRVALLNQRMACNGSNFWELELRTGGALQFETDDATPVHVIIDPTPVVTDGMAHDVVIKRVAEMITITIDGTSAAGGTAQCATSFGALVSMATGTSVCSGEATFSLATGSLSNVCVTSP